MDRDHSFTGLFSRYRETYIVQCLCACAFMRTCMSEEEEDRVGETEHAFRGTVCITRFSTVSSLIHLPCTPLPSYIPSSFSLPQSRPIIPLPASFCSVPSPHPFSGHSPVPSSPSLHPSAQSHPPIPFPTIRSHHPTHCIPLPSPIPSPFSRPQSRLLISLPVPLSPQSCPISSLPVPLSPQSLPLIPFPTVSSPPRLHTFTPPPHSRKSNLLG